MNDELDIRNERPLDPIVLVIEDNIEMLKLIGRFLSAEGYRAILAADSKFGLSLMEEMEPDVILLDIRMPGMDGFKTLQKIREMSDVPVIMVTAEWDPEAIDRAFGMGADDYVKKPFSQPELIARIQAKLRRH